MRRRSSGSTEEDEPEEGNGLQTKSILAEDVGKNKITSSAEPSVSTRHSETLDRRKTDKASAYTQSAEDEATTTRRLSVENTAQGKAKIASPVVPATTDTMNEHLTVRRLRARNPWSTSSLTIGVTILSITLLYAIVNSFINLQRDPKGCKICWMVPAYAKLSGFDTEHTRFASKYSLYLYREQGVDEDTMVKYFTSADCKLCLRWAGQRRPCPIHPWKCRKLQASPPSRSRSSALLSRLHTGQY